MIAWSFSFLNDLANCKRKAWHKFVARDLPKEESKELNYGIAVHKRLEDYVSRGPLAVTDNLLPEAAYKMAEPLRQKGALAELSLGMTNDRKPASFWGKGLQTTWGRGKLDIAVIQPPNALLIDWKTGKEREDPRELFCQSLLLQANYPEIKNVMGAYAWLAQAKMGKLYELSNVERTYHANVAAMEEVNSLPLDEEWEPSPNPLCSWCKVKSCEFNRNDS